MRRQCEQSDLSAIARRAAAEAIQDQVWIALCLVATLLARTAFLSSAGKRSPPECTRILLRRFALDLDHQDIQALDVSHRPAGDTLQIAIESGGGVEHAAQLLLALGP